MSTLPPPLSLHPPVDDMACLHPDHMTATAIAKYHTAVFLVSFRKNSCFATHYLLTGAEFGFQQLNG